MKPFSPKFSLKYLVFWNALRAVWMAYSALLDLRNLALVGHNGPYAGIGIDARFLFIVAAMPTKLIGVMAGFYLGRVGDATVEIVAAVMYACLAVGIWRHRNGVRRLAIALNIFEVLLLMLALSYAAASPLLPELRPPFMFFSSVFAVIYSLITIWLLRGRGKEFFTGASHRRLGPDELLNDSRI